MSPVEIAVTDDLSPLGVDPEMHEAVSNRAGPWSSTPFDTRSIRNRDVLLFFQDRQSIRNTGLQASDQRRVFSNMSPLSP